MARRALGLLSAAMVTLLAGLLYTAAIAQDVSEPTEAEPLLLRLEQEAARIEERLLGDLGPAGIQELLDQLVAQRDQVPPMLASMEAQAAPLRRQLQALGPAPEEGMTESEAVARERGALGAQLDEIEGVERRLSQADARAAALLDQLADLRGRLFKERLLSREPSIFERRLIAHGLDSLADTFRQIRRETEARLKNDMAVGSVAGRLLAPLGIAIVAAVLLLMLRRVVLRSVEPMLRQGMDPARRVGVAFAITLARLLLPAIALSFLAVTAAWSQLLGSQGEALLRGLVQTALLATAAYALGGAFFAPSLPEIRLSRLDEACAARAQRYLIAVAAIVGLDKMLVSGSTGLELGFDAIQAANLALVMLGSLAVWRFERAVSSYHPPNDEDEHTDPDAADDPDATLPPGPGLLTILQRASKVVLLTVAVVAPLLAVAGYQAASRFVFYNPVETAGLIGVFILLFTVVREVVEKMFVRDDSAGTTGASDGSTVQRARLIPVVVGFGLVASAVPLIALIWGAERADLAAGWQVVRDGFDLGEITIAPFDFFGFIAVFLVFYLLTRLAQGILARSVLPLTGLDTGARAAITAGVGYLGFGIAALGAIGFVGADLSNIAIVAGALSVGIGFGLQNVVNNFVSGLILLIERPIKAGDWVELASGMGYVQRVNVRSTVIETFDRASLIVPNSELVSSTVINWTHTNLNGRVIVAVKVAMGSDPRAVEQIMLEIARAHPMVLRRPQPFVLFRGYSDYAMLFEVRAVLRDVNWILNVQSDFYFEIHRRFEEAGIDIPVQRSEVALSGAIPSQIPGQIADPDPGRAPGAGIARLETARRPHAVLAGADPDADGPGDAR
ncbi:MAG: mechanosensitive ion channel domain-containing protein [Pseudomonadota bacterium]